MSSGQIALRAEREERNVRIAITGQPAATDSPPNGNFIREIVAAQGGSVEVSAEDDRISFCMELPSVDLAVLVVDDNADLIHLYRRYVVGTRYRIVHTAQGQRVFEIVEASAPDVIILDVMLPDIDGWELLAHLHEHPATRSIPVVVCSVVREEDLALALGAALYLPKPVERQQFIQALDHVLSQAAAGAPISRANNAAAC
jgi:CheY-like chemotaxis protein